MLDLEQGNIHICLTGVYRRQNPCPFYRQNFRKHNGFIYYISGGHRFSFEDREIEAKTADVVFLPYGASYSNCCIGEKTEYFEINFSVFDDAEPVPVFSEPKCLLPELSQTLGPVFERIYRLHGSTRPMKQMLCVAQLLQMIATIMQSDAHIRKKEQGMDKILPSIQYIQHHYRESVPIERLAEMSYTCVSNLELLFKKCLGMTPIAYRNQLRIDFARQMLAEGYSIKEAAQSSGFQDYAYFAKQFKKMTGISPGKYKKSQHEVL